jgi:hypothetical protein
MYRKDTVSVSEAQKANLKARIILRKQKDEGSEHARSEYQRMSVSVSYGTWYVSKCVVL